MLIWVNNDENNNEIFSIKQCENTAKKNYIYIEKVRSGAHNLVINLLLWTNIKFLVVVTQTPDIYHDWSTQKKFLRREVHTGENDKLWEAQC